MAAQTKFPNGTLAARFIAPPFSVFDARQGYWRDRKLRWIALGVESELGRAGSLVFHKSAQGPCVYEFRNRLRAELGRDPSWDEIETRLKASGRKMLTGTSIFDPVLCEIVYRWFCPARGAILDPFAGGSVRGIVAGRLGRSYRGVDLRLEQVDANRRQAERMRLQKRPDWICGDSREVRALVPGEYDLIFTCPPYGDLERYSDLAADLSTMDYGAFLESLRFILKESAAMLRPDRFACVVVGEIRDKKGIHRGFVPDTIHALQAAGLSYYNEVVLLNNIGSAAIRAPRMFESGRKLARVHQHVLIFVKGDPKRATEAIGKVRVSKRI